MSLVKSVNNPFDWHVHVKDANTFAPKMVKNHNQWTLKSACNCQDYAKSALLRPAILAFEEQAVYQNTLIIKQLVL